MAGKGERTCVVFGAGALGLGFLGPELGRNYGMVYVDIPAKAEFLDYLSESGQYTYNETGQSARAVAVRGVRGISATDEAQVLDALDAAALVFTAVGEPNLPKVAPVLARSVERREEGRPLRILCCENGLEIAAKLRRHIESSLGGNATGRLITADTVMGRMCKVVSPPDEGLSPVGPGFDWAVAAEPFFDIPVPRSALKGLRRPGAAFQPMSDAVFAAREDVKMFAHNGLHAFLAFLGRLKGKSYFCELRGDSQAMSMAYALLMDEVGQALSRKHGRALDRNYYLNYATTILRRTTCPGFRDTIARGTRGVMTKLEPWERLVSGVRLIAAQGTAPEMYATTLAAAIIVARSASETSLSFREVLTRHCGLSETDEAALVELTENRRRWLAQEFPAAQ